MLDKQHEVWFESLAVQPGKQVRLLLFDQSIQLYGAEDEAFLGAYELRAVNLIESDDQFARLRLIPGSGDVLIISKAHLLWPEIQERIGRKNRAKKSLGRNWKWPVLFLGIAGGLLGIYFLLISLLTTVGLELVSIEKEKDLGGMMFRSMAEQMKIDDRASKELILFANKLKLSEAYDLAFTVVDEKDINAFAIPGGHIVVYKGILEEMKEPEELVALLGHEASHINERHSLRSVLRQLSGSVLLTMVFGDLGSVGATIAGQADQLRTLSYSRSLEEDADEKGMERMVKNNVDPKGMLALMDRLQKAETGMALPGFLSTHPLTAERKKTAALFISRHPGHFETSEDLRASWYALKKSLAAKNAVPDPAVEGEAGDW